MSTSKNELIIVLSLLIIACIYHVVFNKSEMYAFDAEEAFKNGDTSYCEEYIEYKKKPDCEFAFEKRAVINGSNNTYFLYEHGLCDVTDTKGMVHRINPRDYKYFQTTFPGRLCLKFKAMK